MKTDGDFVYRIKNSLYLNLTNRCSNACDFCIRNFTDGLAGARLKLIREPEFQEVIADMEPYLPEVEEVVFCGFGEPTYRLALILDICRWLRQVFKGKIRLNTNGQGDLIRGCNISPQFEGLIDRVNISLNAPEAALYEMICHPIFSHQAYPAILEFIRQIKKVVPDVAVSAVTGSGVDMDLMEELAERLAVELVVR